MTDSSPIPAAARPDPDDYSFDLEQRLRSVVSVRTRIPEQALTAEVLGTERAGHGVVISASGLVLTIGYIVTEAESIWVVDHNGASVPAHVVAYDQESGFGLVQGLQPLQVPSIKLGRSSELSPGNRLVLAGAAGLSDAIRVRVEDIREFAGYWEYLLDRAIFTAPAHPAWGGAALIGPDGRLYGIGSLVVETVDEQHETSAANMIIPIDLLPPILDELLAIGQRQSPARPWMGWYVQESDDGLFIVGLVDDGPAQAAGLDSGDRILEIDEQAVDTLPELYRAVWSAGEAGVTISVVIQREAELYQCEARTLDRRAMMVRQVLH